MMHLTDIAIKPDTLNRFYPLNSFDQQALKNLNKFAKLDHLNRYEILFREGSDDEDVYYLISGKIELSSNTGARFVLDAEADQAQYPIANIKPRKFSAYVYSETATIARIPASQIEAFMDLTASDRYFGKNVISHETDKRVLDSDWMMAMKRTPLFQKLQDEYVTRLFHVMEEKTYKAGQHVVLQGETGDYFYLIKKGKCIVSQHNDTRQVVLTELGPTESFGEESLLTHTKRNATITMLSDGLLMRISKQDFEQFMQQPIIHWVNPTQASALLKQGAIPIDVRHDAAELKTLKTAIRIPSNMLRNEIKKLRTDKRYLLLCDDSRDSALASYLFSQRGIDSYILRN